MTLQRRKCTTISVEFKIQTLYIFSRYYEINIEIQRCIYHLHTSLQGVNVLQYYTKSKCKNSKCIFTNILFV